MQRRRNANTPSLVCVQLLGRATDVREYVRKGAKKGSVQITISGGVGKRDVVFRREMYAEKQAAISQSKWWINGAPRLSL